MKWQGVTQERRWVHEAGHGTHVDAHIEGWSRAVETVAALEAENARLREALAPFARTRRLSDDRVTHYEACGACSAPPDVCDENPVSCRGRDARRAITGPRSSTPASSE